MSDSKQQDVPGEMDSTGSFNPRTSNRDNIIEKIEEVRDLYIYNRDYVTKENIDKMQQEIPKLLAIFDPDTIKKARTELIKELIKYFEDFQLGGRELEIKAQIKAIHKKMDMYLFEETEDNPIERRKFFKELDDEQIKITEDYYNSGVKFRTIEVIDLIKILNNWNSLKDTASTT